MFDLIMSEDMFVKRPLILEGPVALGEGALEFLLLHHVHGAGGEQHGAAPAYVCLVGLQHDIGTVPVPEHNFTRESLYQDLGNVLSVGPGDQLLLRDPLAY